MSTRWKSTALSKVAVIERSAIQPAEIEEGTPYLGLEHIESGGKILGAKPVDAGELASSKFRFSAKHVLYGKLRPYLAKITCPDFTGICSTDILPILPGSNLDRRFLCYFLRQPSMVEHANSRTSGANLPRLSPTALAEFEIPLPPLAEQKRIAGILDAADALRAKRRESLAQLDTLLQSTFLTLFGDPVSNPMGWEMKKLKDLTTRILSGNTPKGGREVYTKTGITFFRSQNVWRNKIDLDDIAYIDDATHRMMSKSSLKNRDILITKTGRFNTENSSLGRAALFVGPDHSANINGHVYLVRLKEGLIHEFVLFVLTTDEYREYIRRVCVGGIDKRQINKEHLNEFPIISPPLDLQRRFAAIVESVERQKARQRAHLAELDALFASLQHRAFRGEL